jgi:hypothetical protein
MSAKTYARFRFLCLGLFVIGVVSAAVAFSLDGRHPGRRHAKGFTLVTKETVAPTTRANLGQMGYIVAVRYRRSDGTWKQIRTYKNSNGKVLKRDIAFGVPGNGVFYLDRENRTLEFISPMPPTDETSYVQPMDGHSDPHFLKDDVVQGYATFVLRFPEDAGGGYTDLYYAPELDNLTIKRVTISATSVSIMEPVTITLGDPDDINFGSFPKWVVNFEHFKDKIRAMEESGNHEAAQRMQQELDDQLSKKVRDQ